jgi:hypothetical protein
MVQNEFLNPRVITASFSVPDAAASQAVTSPAYIPAGAIITGISFINTAAPTVAGVSATLDLRAGSEAIIKTVNMKNVASAQTKPYAATISGTTPLNIIAGGALVLSVGASGAGGSNWTFSPDVYIGYIQR